MASLTQALELLPDIAWEQAVFVCLFLVFAFYMMNWMSKQQDKWTQFTKERDEYWQNWLDKANCSTTDAMKSVTEALTTINNNLHSLAQQLDQHDDNAKELVEKAVVAVNGNKERKTQPRPK